MFAARMHVVREQVIVRDEVPLLGMIPEPAGILNQFAVMVNQGVIDRNRAILAIAGGRVSLQPFQAMRIDALDIPRSFGQPAVEAGLVGGSGKLTIDATDRLMPSDEQAGQVLGEVPARWLVREQIAKL